MTRGPDASSRLARAIECAADRAGLTATVTHAAATPWASATFAGARHVLVLTVMPSPDLDDWLAALPEAELPVRGHLVADLNVVANEATDGSVAVTLEVLTVEER